MTQEDSGLDEDLGEATIVYEGAEGTEERTVPNEHVAYFQDHWIVKTGEDDAGRDTVRRIPAFRVYHVERTVEAFEAEVATFGDQVRSFTADLRRKLPIDGGEGGRERGEAVEIDVEEETTGGDAGAGGAETGGDAGGSAPD